MNTRAVNDRFVFEGHAKPSGTCAFTLEQREHIEAVYLTAGFFPPLMTHKAA